MQDMSIQPFVSSTDEAAKELRNKIVNSPNGMPENFSGTVWYLSSNGNDNNTGTSAEDGWGTLSVFSQKNHLIKAGDIVLFERGGVFRGYFETVSGVYYGAYGEGEKPKLYASTMNYALAKWENEGNNIWRCCEEFTCDVGNVIFDERWSGYKRATIDLLKEDGDFCSIGEKLYIYMNGNPTELYSDIEACPRLTVVGLFNKQHDVTIENLCIKYTGAHGVGAADGVKNITVKNCEFGVIGGSYLCDTLRFGNAIEFFDSCDNILVENNWIYQVYDSGFTHQGGANYKASNILVQNNLIETCGMGSIEYWLAYDNDHYNSAENVIYRNNIMRFAGYCWGGIQRSDKVSAHIVSNGANQNHFTNQRFENNIFDRSSCRLIEITSMDKTFPVFNGNTYIQEEGSILGTFDELENVVFDSKVEKVIKETWGDKDCKIGFQ